MSHLLARWSRWWRSSRIRLPKEVDPATWRPGDRLQIGPRLWRIAACHRHGPAYDLIAAEGAPARASLRWTESGWRWTVGDRALELGVEEVEHFPVRPWLEGRFEPTSHRLGP